MVQLICKWISTSQRLALLLALTCIAALTSAYIAQYGFHIYPCHLCYHHRMVYAVIAGLMLFAAVPALKHCRLMLFAAASIGAAIGVGIAGHHVAVEHKWVELPQACMNAYMDGNTLEEVKAEIMNEPVVPCDRVAWKFLGLSMTEYSFLLFVMLLAAMAHGIRLARREQ